MGMHYRAYECLRYGYPYDVDLKLCIEIRTQHNNFILIYGLWHGSFRFFFSAGHLRSGYAIWRTRTTVNLCYEVFGLYVYTCLLLIRETFLSQFLAAG